MCKAFPLMVAVLISTAHGAILKKHLAARSLAAAGLPDPHCKTGIVSFKLVNVTGKPRSCCAGYCGACNDYDACKSVRGQNSENACCASKVYAMRCGSAPANVCLKKCSESVPPCIMDVDIDTMPTPKVKTVKGVPPCGEVVPHVRAMHANAKAKGQSLADINKAEVRLDEALSFAKAAHAKAKKDLKNKDIPSEYKAKLEAEAKKAQTVIDFVEKHRLKTKGVRAAVTAVASGQKIPAKVQLKIDEVSMEGEKDDEKALASLGKMNSLHGQAYLAVFDIAQKAANKAAAEAAKKKAAADKKAAEEKAAKEAAAAAKAAAEKKAADEKAAKEAAAAAKAAADKAAADKKAAEEKAAKEAAAAAAKAAADKKAADEKAAKEAAAAAKVAKEAAAAAKAAKEAKAAAEEKARKEAEAQKATGMVYEDAAEVASGTRKDLGDIGISGNDPRTVAFWMKSHPKDRLAHPVLFGMGTWGQTCGVWDVKLQGWSGCVGVMGYRCDFYPNTQSHKCKNPADNTWHHVAVAFDGSILTTYLDGVKELDHKIKYNTAANTKSSFGGAHHYNYKGSLMGLKVFKSALSAEEIAKIHSDGKAALPAPPAAPQLVFVGRGRCWGRADGKPLADGHLAGCKKHYDSEEACKQDCLSHEKCIGMEYEKLNPHGRNCAMWSSSYDSRSGYKCWSSDRSRDGRQIKGFINDGHVNTQVDCFKKV